MKKFFKVLAFELAAALLLTSFGNGGLLSIPGSGLLRAWAADSTPVSICYDGKILEFSQADCIERRDGYFLAPAGEIAALTGWSSESYKDGSGADCVRLTNPLLDLTLEACDGQKKFTVNGRDKPTGGAAEVVNGVMLIPVKDFFYTMNCSVRWEESISTIVVTSPLTRVFSGKDAVIRKAAGAPVIDGDGNDVAWANAQQNGKFSTAYYNETPASDTQFKVTYDDSAIYFLISCAGRPVPLEGLSLVLATEDAIGPDTPYYNAVLIPEPDNNLGRPGGLYVMYRTANEIDITGFEAKYAIGSDSWTAEVKIPYDKLVAPAGGEAPKPAAGDEWRLNVSRIRPFTEGISTWVPVRNSMYYDQNTDDIRYSADLSYTPTTGRTGSIFFEKSPEVSVFDGTPRACTAVAPQNAGMRYTGYDTKLFYFDRPESFTANTTFYAEWVNELGVRYNAQLLKVIDDGSKLYFSVRHPAMPNDGLYRLNIYVYDGGAGVKKYEMMFDRQQVMDAGVTFTSFVVNTEAANKRILTNTNLKESEQSDAVKKLISIIPDAMGFIFTGSPTTGAFKYDYAKSPFSVSVVDSSNNTTLTVQKSIGATGPIYTTTPDTYKDNRSLTVTSGTGKQVTYNYYEDDSGRKYFLDAQVNYQAKEYLKNNVSGIALSDPLGAAWVLYEIAKAYQDWMPTCDYYWSTYPVQWNWGPPYSFWGGIWDRWSVAELDSMKDIANAYAAVKNTNALDIVSDQVGTNVEDLLINGMFKKDLELTRTYPELYMNYEYKNWIGEVTLGKALNEPDYIHQVVDTVNDYVKGYFLLDGFWKEVTLSYHTQSLAGVIDTCNNLKGWSDPADYISPRNVKNIQNLDMISKFNILKSANLVAGKVIYPNGKYYPIQDTWAYSATSTTAADQNLGSILMPAANIARMSKGTSTGTSQLYMTYAPQYGSHYHYDPLNLSLYSCGQELLPDLGYTHTKFKPWVVSTMGHNTVVVDSKDAVEPASASYGGKVDTYADIDSTVQIMKADQENAYPGIGEYDREPWYIKMEGSKDSYILDIFRIDGGSRHEYTLNGDANSEESTFTPDIDMADYNTQLVPPGTVITPPTSETDGGSAVYNGQNLYYGYISIENVKKASLADGKYEITMSTKNKGADTAGMKITGFAGENSELYIGKAPSLGPLRTGAKGDSAANLEGSYMPKMVIRREGTNLQSTFVNIMEPYAAGSSAKIESIVKLDTANPKDVAVKLTYGNVTDVLISSSDPSVPMTVSDGELGSIALTGKMAFIRYIGGGISKVYTVGADSITVDGRDIDITGGGSVKGGIIGTMRTEAGAEKNALIVDRAVPDSAVGRTITVTHPDGSVHAFGIESVTSEGGNSIIGIKDYDPGFDINSDGSSQMLFYPSTRWNSGSHTFKIEMDTVTDYGLSAERTKQRATLYTTQERLNARDNIGKGYAWAVSARDNALAAADTYAAKTDDELWSMITPESLDKETGTVLQALSEAYMYTDDVKYARAGLILLDRIADMYPDIEFAGSLDEYSLEQTLIKAYDAFYPAVDNASLIAFLSAKAKANNLANPKISGDWICKNIEDRILRQVWYYAQDPSLTDNYGMGQASLALAAVVLDSNIETSQWLDFAFRTGGVENGKVTGGNVSASLINNADRDGMGDKGSSGYNGLWAQMLLQIADALDGYDKYTKVDLYSDPSFVKLLTALYPLSAAGKYTVQIGDSCEAGASGIAGSVGNAVKGFEKTGSITLAQLAYYLNNNSFEGLHSGILTANAESVKDRIAKVIEDNGGLEPDSTTLPGYGFSILRDGASPYSQLRSSTSFNDMVKQSSSVITKYFANGATQLEATAVGANMTYQFTLPGDGLYRIDITPYKATSYGIYDVYIDDVKKTTIDFCGSTGVNSGTANIVEDTFTAGDHYIKFECVGKSAASKGYKMGVISFITTRHIIKEDTRRDFWMYYGNTQPLHSHRDQLNLGVHAYGLDMAPDLGSPEDSWTAGTLSHNTVVVDNSDQQAAQAGKPLYFDDSGSVQVMDAQADGAYPQAQMYRRSVVAVKVSEEDSYSVDFFRVKGGKDHTYSFHGAVGPVETTGLDLAARPGGAADKSLDNVRKDSKPSDNFSVDYNLGNGQADSPHLRLTMLGECDDVSLADYTYGDAGNPVNMEYVLAHRKGGKLESVFTSVIEPYKESRYIQSIEEAQVTSDGRPVQDMEARAVKVTLKNGRTDYIVSALDSTKTYNIDGKFDFKGVEGVYSELDGTVVINYVNDGTVIGDVQYDTAAVTGTVTGFTKELSGQNRISVALDGSFDASRLAGRYIDISNDGAQNGVYRIKGIVFQEGTDVTFDIGTTSVIRSYLDSNDLSKGFVYNIAEGNRFSIPLGNMSARAFALDNNVIGENNAAGDEIGAFCTTEIGRNVSYELAEGAAGNDNACFTLEGNVLKANAVFNYNSKNIYNIRVKAAFEGGVYEEQDLQVHVLSEVQAFMLRLLGLSSGDREGFIKDVLEPLDGGTASSEDMAQVVKAYFGDSLGDEGILSLLEVYTDCSSKDRSRLKNLFRAFDCTAGQSNTDNFKALAGKINLELTGNADDTRGISLLAGLLSGISLFNGPVVYDNPDNQFKVELKLDGIQAVRDRLDSLIGSIETLNERGITNLDTALAAVQDCVNSFRDPEIYQFKKFLEMADTEIYSGKASSIPVPAAKITASSGGDGYASLTWEPLPGADGYIVRYGTEKGTYTMELDAGNALSSKIDGLVNNTAYYFTVAGYYGNRDCYAYNSNEVRVKPMRNGK